MRTIEIMRRIDARDFRLEFCSLSGQPGELDPEIERLGGRVHLLRLDPSFPRRFRQLIRRRGYDLVHSHVYFSSGLMLLLAASQGVPHRIAHFRNTTDGGGSGLLRRARQSVFRRLIDRYATNIVAVGTGALEEAWSRFWYRDPRCHVLHNGLDLTPFSALADREAAARTVRQELGLAPESRLIIHVGRPAKQKNHERVVDLFSLLRSRLPEARLLLVGGPRSELEARLGPRLAARKLGDEVIFTGTRVDVPRLLRAADLLLFPSLWEGIPGVVLEACAAGIPTLASALPGVKEIAADFPRVCPVELAEGDPRWVAAGRELLDRYPLAEPLEAIEANFRRSKFDFDRAVRRHELLWRGELGG